MRFNPDRDSEQREATLRARALRREMSVPEIKLWQRLRGGRVHGAKFRRQHPIGPFTADFYCAEVGLVVELDGGMHDREHDERRDAFMRELGLHVLRLAVSSFERDVDAAVEGIARLVRERRGNSSHPLPLL
jgi:very-short-patch-repair endonuclease